MLRIMGALLLMGAVGGLCLFHTREEDRRVRECEGLLLLVRHLRTQIEVYRTPVAAALASFQNQALEAAGFLAAARKRGLGSAMLTEGRCLCLDAGTGKMLLSLSEGLQTPVWREAVSLCEAAEGELSALLAKRKREAPARLTSHRALFVFFGLTVLLVLG